MDCPSGRPTWDPVQPPSDQDPSSSRPQQPSRIRTEPSRSGKAALVTNAVAHRVGKLRSRAVRDAGLPYGNAVRSVCATDFGEEHLADR